MSFSKEKQKLGQDGPRRDERASGSGVLMLYAMCGLPFAGKSTVAQRLAAETGAVVVKLDEINGERGLGLDAQAVTAEAWESTYAEAYRRLENALASGNSVIFDHVNFTRAERDRVREIAARKGAQIQIVYVEVTAEEARRRLLANRADRVRNDVQDEDFALVVEHFEAPDDEPDVSRWADRETRRTTQRYGR